MDYLIDQAINEKKINKELLPYDIRGPCKLQQQAFTNSTLELLFNTYSLNNLKKGNKVIQTCKNFRCVNPSHLREVSYEIWFKNGLEAELLWMDYV
jgi:hypothetical protein